MSVLFVLFHALRVARIFICVCMNVCVCECVCVCVCVWMYVCDECVHIPLSHSSLSLPLCVRSLCMYVVPVCVCVCVCVPSSVTERVCRHVSLCTHESVTVN